MKPLVAAAAIVVLGVVPVAPASAQSAGLYTSTLDNRQYELRINGGNELVVYTGKGQIAAVLTRKSAADPFKGETTSDMAASPCPKNIGKIETVQALDDRIRMRLETPQKNVKGQLACKMLVVYGQHWKPFEFVLRPGAGPSASVSPAPAPAPASSPAPAPADGAEQAPVLTQSYEKVDFTAKATATSATDLTVELVAVNRGDDRVLTVGSGPNNIGLCHLARREPGSRLTVTDGDNDTDSKYENGKVTIAGKPVRQLMVNTDDKVAVTLLFGGLKSSRGVLKAPRIRRLDVAVSVGDRAANTCGVLTFTNVPIAPAK